MIKEKKITPLMQQYHAIRSEYPDTLLLFQVGDFYELFFDDAKQAAAYLGIALTTRGKNNGEPIPLCGVPVHALDHYVSKLIKGGFKVAICDQLEEAQPGKVVRRGVTQVLTPGTLTDTKLLDDKSASYLLSFFPAGDKWGVVFGELMTAQLFATVLPAHADKKLDAELIRFFPDEIIIPHTKLAKSFQSYFKQRGYFTTFVHDDPNEPDKRSEIDAWLEKQFQSNIVKAVNEFDSLRLALSYFYAYVQRSQQSALDQFKSLYLYKPEDFLLLDPATQRNLELVKNAQDGGRRNTLFSVIDGATTPMGSRMIKKWLLRPLIKQKAIEQRQDALEICIHDIAFMQHIENALQKIGDIERVIGRIALRRAHLHDYCALMSALTCVPIIISVLHDKKETALFAVIMQHISDFSKLKKLLESALNTDQTKQWLIKKGFDTQLDHLRELVTSSNQKILELERSERDATGINSLKIRYNKVHGYYIEITKTHLDAVPDHYVRQQTLVGKERYITQELQQLQSDIVCAKNEIEQVEKQVFERVQQEVLTYITSLRKLAHALAHLDALVGLAKIAYNNGYVRPTFNTKREIFIQDGRHPVVEQQCDGRFVPNSTQLSDNESLWIITGPNMGGKSTYLRQVAHACILAQVGAFVPAHKADLALVDRVFTRIGASDNVAEGKSTFLVEMEETASICSQATENSLVILDEVGRGTSTFDGLAIAQAVVEYIYTIIKARCLFATHYHELTHLQERYPGIVSYHAASKETPHGIVFLHKIVHGVADGSFGVQVAKLAQLPDSVIDRAHQLVEELGAVGQQGLVPAVKAQNNSAVYQENRALKKRLESQNKLAQIIQSIDYDELSPKKAFDLLWDLKEQI